MLIVSMLALLNQICSVDAFMCCFFLSLVLFDLFVNILTHNLAEPAYEADVAQLEYKLVAGEHGLVIKVKGFNHKLPVRGIYVNTISKLSVEVLK